MEWTVIFLFLIALFLLFIYYYVVYGELRGCGIPGPTPWPFVGSMVESLRTGLLETEKKWTKKYGRIYGSYFGQRSIVTVSDLELLKNVMVKDFHMFQDRRQQECIFPRLVLEGVFFKKGEDWRRTRNVMTPAFSTGKLKKMMDELNRCSSTLASSVQEHADTGEALNIKDFVSAFTMDVIASTGFGLQIDSQKCPDEPFVKNACAIFNQSGGFVLQVPFLLAVMFPTLGYILRFFGKTFWPKHTITFFEQTGHALVEDRKKNPSDRIDILQLLLNAEYDENNSETDPDNKKTSVKRLSTYEIVAQAFLFFMAGFETTGSTLRFCAYRLAIHPDIDAKIYSEIEEHINESVPDYDSVSKLKYMDCFINEVLRMYPPLPRQSREVSQDVFYQGMKIPKGTGVGIPAYLIHHDPEYFPDPENFEPERFLPENKHRMKPLAFMPFGHGPRQCLGMRMALFEIKVALVHLLKKVRFVKCPETQIPLKIISLGFLSPADPVMVAVEKRNN